MGERIEDRIEARRSKARELRVLDKVMTICRVLGEDKSLADSPIDEWVFHDDETGHEYRYRSSGEATVLDGRDQRLFTNDPLMWRDPIRAFRPDPVWLARLDNLFLAAATQYGDQLKQLRRADDADLRDAFGFTPKTQPRRGYEP